MSDFYNTYVRQYQHNQFQYWLLLMMASVMKRVVSGRYEETTTCIVNNRMRPRSYSLWSRSTLRENRCGCSYSLGSELHVVRKLLWVVHRI